MNIIQQPTPLNPLSDTICFFNTTSSWGGGEKWHLEMSRCLLQRGYKVKLVAGPGSELYHQALDAGIPVTGIRVSAADLLNPFKIRFLVNYFRRNEVNTIIINDPRDLKVGGLAGRRAGVQHILYRRGSAIAIRNTFLNRWIFKQVVDGVIANSRQTAHTILENNPALIGRDKIHVIYNGMDLPRFDSLPSAPPYRRQGNEVIIGHAGRLTRQKGQHHLLDMAGMLKKRGVDFKLLMAGKGPLEGALKKSAADRGLAREVVFMGFTNNIKDLMLASDIFVLPSLWEGFGYVLTEAMACGKPVVAFDISSNPEIVADGETGFLVAPFNVEAMTGKVMLLASDPALRHKMGAAGRQRVEQRFTLNHAATQIETLLQTRLPNGLQPCRP